MREKLPQSIGRFYPFEPRYVKLRDGRNMHYISEGSGETVLFLHGYPTWSFFFRELIVRLRPNFKCMAIDHIGHGLSDKPWGYKYEIKTHIENAMEFVEMMKFKKFHIVAQDFGVAIALAMAEFWPERISSMSLLNSAIFITPKVPPIVLMFKLPLLGFCMSIFFNLFTRICLHLGIFSDIDDDILNGYLWPYRKLAARSALSSEANDIPWLQDHRSLDTLDSICEKAFLLANKKIKFFWADDDFRYDVSVLKYWGKILPNATVKHYQGGHLLLEDSPEAIGDIRLFIHGAQDISKDLFKRTP